MKESRTRRITLAQATDAGLRITGDVRRVIFLPWSGLGSILGGILWVTLLFLLPSLHNLDYYPFNPDCADCSIPYDIGSTSYLLAIPMLVFVASLIILYLYAQYEMYPNWTGNLGGLVALMGSTLVIAHTLGKFWIRWFGGYGGFISEPTPALTLIWYASLGPGFIIFSFGLVLFAMSTIKSGAMTTKDIMPLIVTSVAINLYPIALRLGLLPNGYEQDVSRYYDLIFTVIWALYGVSWMWLGAILLIRGSNVPNHPEAT